MRCKRICPGKLLLSIAAIGILIGTARSTAEKVFAEDAADDAETAIPAVLDFDVETIDGETISLDQYHGDVVLIVNVASKCGLTPQYKQLQQLHEKHAEAGLSILGFPANNFGQQEPGSNDEIATFCEQNYGVEFDMFAKVSVEGDDQAPLYAFLTSEETNPDYAGRIQWNFDKFLVSREGEVIARFSPRTKPSDKKVLKAIKDALAKPVPESVQAKREVESAEDAGE